VAVASAGPYAICTSLQTDNHASTPPLSFLQDGCPSCRPTNSVKAQKAVFCYNTTQKNLCVQLYPLRRQQLLKNEPKIKAENNKDALLNTNVKMASCSRI